MKKYYIGVDLGGTNTRTAVLGNNFRVLRKSSFPTSLFKSHQKLLSAINSSILDLLKDAGIPLKSVEGMGIGVAGLVDAESGVVANLVNIPGWKRVNIKGYFEKTLRVPAFVDNDVNVMTLAEFYKGAGKGCRNLICVTLGTGVGGGIVIEGELYRGSTSSAGEIGHIPINMKGPKCNCGGVACIESYAGNRNLIRELRGVARKNRGSILRKLADRDLSNLTPELACRAAAMGDRPSIDFWEETGSRIGVMLTGVVNFLDPDRIVIGGGVAGAARFLFPSIRETIGRRAMEVQRRHVRVVKARLGSEAGLVGAAVLVDTERKR